MNLLNTRSEYGFISRALHWIIVLAIVAQSIGLTILLLAIVRLVWRFLNPTPAWPADMKSYEVTLARAVHFGFYMLLFAIPIAGWALSSVEDEPLRFLLHVIGAAKHCLVGRLRRRNTATV